MWHGKTTWIDFFRHPIPRDVEFWNIEKNNTLFNLAKSKASKMCKLITKKYRLSVWCLMCLDEDNLVYYQTNSALIKHKETIIMTELRKFQACRRCTVVNIIKHLCLTKLSFGISCCSNLNLCRVILLISCPSCSINNVLQRQKVRIKSTCLVSKEKKDWPISGLLPIFLLPDAMERQTIH